MHRLTVFSILKLMYRDPFRPRLECIIEMKVEMKVAVNHLLVEGEKNGLNKEGVTIKDRN